MTRLHVRSRYGPEVVAGVMVVALLAWAAAEWLSSRPYFDGPQARPPVAALAPVFAAVLVSVTLAGADEELERSAARRWWPIRLAHVLIATAVCAAALALTGLWEPTRCGAAELARNTVASVGLVTVATALAGAARAWAPVIAYTGVVYLAAPKPVIASTAWWTWPVQPASAPLAWWAAAAWFAAGLVLYARNGARVAADREA
ncbi:hypothetical protein [Jiangella alba]|uniref:Uncharacterized protein n=1 Tax=Jiangella alba TaxID=561176 RepID=A0A1H5IAM4_9ACTN|nr:hypothetical protein [Jiangella alba]SEE36558.1 hypothetical protein SAMN04488561_1105 [Jiangella alba]